MSDEAPNNKAILEAITALDVKVEKRFDELVRVDTTLTEEVQRIARKQERMDQDIRDLRSETDRKLDAERHATQSTVEAMTKHFEAASTTFHEKAADIDDLKSMQVKQMQAMGLEKERTGFWAWLQKQDVKDVIRILTLIAAVIGTIATALGVHK